MAISQSGLPTPLQPQAVDLGASEIANAGRMVSSGLAGMGDAALSIDKDMSNQRAITQLSSFKDTLDKAKISMLTDPSSSNLSAQKQIVDGAANISNSIPLMGSDKKTLSSTISALQANFHMELATSQVKSNRRSQALQFQEDFPNSLSAITQLAMQGSTKLAQANSEKLLSNTANLVQQGILPPAMYGRVHQAISSMVQRSNYLSANSSKVGSDPLAVSHQQNMGLGVEGNNPGSTAETNLKTGSILGAYNLTSAKAAALSGSDVINYIMDPSTHQNNALYLAQYSVGVNHSLAVNQAGLSYPKLEAVVNNFGANHGALNPEQEGQRDKLSEILTNIKKGQYYNYYVNTTNDGKEALSNYNNELETIKQSPRTPEAKQQLSIQQEQLFYRKMVAYGNAQKIPAQYIKPIAPGSQVGQLLSSSFQPGADVSTLATVLRSDKTIEPYISASVSSPRGQEAAHLAAIAPTEEGASLILKANQTGIQFPTETKTSLLGSVSTIKTSDIAVSLSGDDNVNRYLNFIAAMPGGVNRKATAQKSLYKGMQYCLSTPGNDLKSCTSKISNHVVPSRDSYLSGTNYNFLNSEFSVPLSDSDALMLSKYVADQTYQKIKDNLTISQKDSPATESQKQAAQMSLETSLLAHKEVNPLQITNGPDGKILAFDKQTGTVQGSFDLTPGMLHLAREKYKRSMGAIEKAIGFGGFPKWPF